MRDNHDDNLGQVRVESLPAAVGGGAEGKRVSGDADADGGDDVDVIIAMMCSMKTPTLP